MSQIIITPRASQHATEFTWALADVPALAGIVADIALGQVEHAERILHASSIASDDPPTDQNIGEAIAIIKGMPVEHRDGWMFQVISWVAWYVEGEMTLIRAPLPTATRQGFDGVSVSLAADDSVIESVTVSEDKATLNPRDVVRDDVLPEFERLAKGQRESQLRAELVALIKAGGFQPTTILKQGDWRNRKRFRASLCTSQNRIPPTIELYEGFASSAPGDPLTRRGHRLVLEDMRGFFQELATRVMACLEALKQSPDV
ncbi:MAG: hypothetical protein KGJ62_02235 [Armatimonadetes bacterium]|nr:hypothetical protein [Armatimonadota bacterium]MDE2205361.1 hypothetical protein [Armatimonadota bacterium]